jgi:nucleotide-binding universal stress UspA family protein
MYERVDASEGARQAPGDRPGYRTVLADFPPTGSLRGGRRPVVVGVDGSPPALHALEWAVELAADLEVELIAVHAGVAVDVPAVDLRDRAGLSVAGWCDAHRGNAVLRAVEAIAPAPTALVEVCREENAHCLVIGTRHPFGHPHRGRLLAALTWQVGCPVLVVPVLHPELRLPT